MTEKSCKHFRRRASDSQIFFCRRHLFRRWQDPLAVKSFTWQSSQLDKFVYNPNKSTLKSSNDPNKSILISPRVLHTFSSTTSMCKKKIIQLVSVEPLGDLFRPFSFSWCRFVLSPYLCSEILAHPGWCCDFHLFARVYDGQKIESG